MQLEGSFKQPVSNKTARLLGSFYADQTPRKKIASARRQLRQLVGNYSRLFRQLAQEASEQLF